MSKRFLARVMISLPSLIFWISVVLFDRTMQTAASVTAALLHELGHIAAMKSCHIGVAGIRILPYGLEITSSRPPRSFSEDILVSAAGCAANLVSAPVFYLLGCLLGGAASEFSFLISGASVMLAILNALPISTLDGGCTLEASLSLILSPESAFRVTRCVSFVFLVLLWICAAYIFLFSGYNYSMFAMTVWLFARIYCPAA